jgi:transposase
VLVEAAWSAAKSPGRLRAFAQRTAAKRGRHVATVAVARKLAVLAWHLLTRGEDYAYQQPGLVARKLRRLELAAGAPHRKPGPKAHPDVRLLVDHRERLVGQRAALICDLRWHLHDLWPELEIPARALTSGRWQDRLAGRLARAEQTARVRIARDELCRIRELTRSIDALQRDLSRLVAALAPQLLDERGCGVLIAAKLIGEIAGIQRFASDAKLARIAGSAPIPASSGRTTRHRLDRGGNRQLNCALHRLAVTKGRLDPDTAAYLARK